MNPIPRPVRLFLLVSVLTLPVETMAATAGGVFVGRSGKPMAKARVVLGAVAGDQQLTYATVKLGAKPPSAVTDAEGRFQFADFAPGRYTIVYQPAGSAAPALPPEMDIRRLSAVIPSFMPLLKGVEVGSRDPYPDRSWARGEFTLLKGHTLYTTSIGEPTMKIWNATVRKGTAGPYVEIRRGMIWMEQLQDKNQLKFEAWSY